MIQEIKAFVKRNSYLEESGSETETRVGFTTREKGDSCAEEYSATDYNEALRVEKLVLEKFEGIETEVYTIDEWVDLEVRIKD